MSKVAKGKRDGVYPGYVHMGHYGSRGDGIAHTIEISDVETGARIKIELTHEQFGLIMSNSSLQVDVEWTALQTLGLKYEHKTVRVPVPWSHSPENGDGPRIAEEAEVLEPFEVDCWRGRASDLRNWHRHDRDGKQDYYNVHFSRYVDPETGNPVEV